MTPATPDEPVAAAPEVPQRLVFTSTAVLATSLVFSVILMISAMYGWYAIGVGIRSQISWVQLATLVFFILLMIGIMLSVGYSRLWADEDGVSVRNGPVLRKFSLDEIAGVRLRQGDAWAYLLIKDGHGGVRRRAVLAIQQIEGDKARAKRSQLRAWLKANGANAAGVDKDSVDPG